MKLEPPSNPSRIDMSTRNAGIGEDEHVMRPCSHRRVGFDSGAVLSMGLAKPWHLKASAPPATSKLTVWIVSKWKNRRLSPRSDVHRRPRPAVVANKQRTTTDGH